MRRRHDLDITTWILGRREMAIKVGLLATATFLSLWVKPTLSDVVTNSTTNDPFGIVIMAQGRSGSTMLGETFRQNKEVLYFFEPCRAWGEGLFASSWGVYHRELLGHECSQLLRRLATCEFTSEDSARLAIDSAALGMGSSQLELLRQATESPTATNLYRAHEKLLSECKSKRAVVVKSIRADAGIYDVHGGTSGIRILHLVRDPRAVVHSQSKTFNVAHKYRKYFSTGDPSPVKGLFIHEEATKTANGMERLTELPMSGRQRARVLGLIVCDVYQRQLKSSASLSNERYMLVRYEDVARSVERAVENVYRWSGLGEVPTRVSLWIDENTRLHDCADSNNNNHNDIDNGVLSVGANADAVTERGYDAQTAGYSGQAGGGAGKGVSSHRQPSPSECKQKTAERASWDRYGTRRHTAVMAELWRTQMPGDEAMAVWDACTDSRVMDSLGYNQ